MSPRRASLATIACCLAAAFAAALSPRALADDVSAVKPGQNAGAELASQLRSGDWHAREGMYFQRNWGVEIVGLRRVASGYMLRLDLRVVDPEKARPLFDQKVRPYVIDEVSGARLAVPAMENVGELRQTAKPTADRTYFMIFGNPEKIVKPGGLVTIVIGNFRVDGYTVD
jgi:hypothetical protein